MLAVRLPENLEERLSHLAKQTHRSKSYYVKQALQDFLDEQEALSRLKKKSSYKHRRNGKSPWPGRLNSIRM